MKKPRIKRCCSTAAYKAGSVYTDGRYGSKIELGPNTFDQIGTQFDVVTLKI